MLETHLAWLHGECAGDWVLRIDGDELVSPALVAALPELIAAATTCGSTGSRGAGSTRRQRLATTSCPGRPTTTTGSSATTPRLRFEATLHSGAVPQFPAQYSAEPFYHLLCAVETFERRSSHSLRYELAAAALLAPGGGPLNATFYLPELFARRRAAAAARGGRRAGQVGAAVSVRLLEPDLRMYAGEHRGLLVEVTQHGGRALAGRARRRSADPPLAAGSTARKARARRCRRRSSPASRRSHR